MKFLFDNNLSHKLVERLKDIIPGSTHVMIEGLDESDDWEIWTFAKKNGFTIITKDSDYYDLSLLYRTPPKVIWLRTGNCKVQKIENLIREQFDILVKFLDDPDSGIIEMD